MYSSVAINRSQRDSFSQLGARAFLSDRAKMCSCDLKVQKNTANTHKAVRKKKYCVTKELQKRAERIVAKKIEYVFHDEFDMEDACDQILGPLQELCTELNPDSEHDFSASSSEYVALYTVPLLEKEHESILFKGMNYLKYRAAILRDSIDLKSPCIGLLDRIEQMLKDAQQLRNYIIQANLRLVVSIAKNLSDRANLFDDLISDAHLPLIRAVEIFDVGRGNRFSTYGTWAVRNYLFRSTKKGRKYRKMFQNSVEPVALGLTDYRSTQRSEESYHAIIQGVLQKVMNSLDEREQWILKRRFGLHHSNTPQKFREIAEDLGVSTERVRQLTIRSLQRLREVAEEQNLDIPEFI
ncbi:sigma-70 family RNA polymerase sigma factor [Gimesia aquarii]|uniref:RNA polymerase principal sigma factor HrdB n=1 Tax=Gimesia aquarii TaxID=2527964 RepID=A0A517WZ43_9PLAN|nr:sigma-70 family RNA polymerase sigma factor [Gimesia aquarii]QDU10525.1 RNA polymerase principal sigma factor HrdB [Gimesia aquarii]